MKTSTDLQAQGTPATAQRFEIDLISIENEIINLNQKKSYFKNLNYLFDLAENTFIKNQKMAEYNNGEISTKLISNPQLINYHLSQNNLSKYFSTMGRRFRDLDESAQKPLWFNKAYEAAIIVQKYYNNNLK